MTSDVKRHKARSVLGRGTAWEALKMLSAFHCARMGRRCVASCIAMDDSIGGSWALPDTTGGSYRSEGWEFESLCSYLGPLRQSIFFCRGLHRGGLSEFHSGYSSVGRASDCRLTQRSDGPWFDSGWPDFPRLAAACEFNFAAIPGCRITCSQGDHAFKSTSRKFRHL